MILKHIIRYNYQSINIKYNLILVQQLFYLRESIKLLKLILKYSFFIELNV